MTQNILTELRRNKTKILNSYYSRHYTCWHVHAQILWMCDNIERLVILKKYKLASYYFEFIRGVIWSLEHSSVI
ncbi:MAG: hypothetical protein Q8P20_00185 [bacterium]|nr:hypothetical protein [bacterium]